MHDLQATDMSFFLEAQFPALASLLLGALVFGSAPLLLHRFLRCRTLFLPSKERKSRGVSFLTYVGNGFLFAAAMLYLIPEAHHEFSHLAEEGRDNDTHAKEHHHHEEEEGEGHHHHHSLPLAELMVACGFFAAYLVEVLVSPPRDQHPPATTTSPTTRTKFCSCSQRTIECSRIYKPDVSPARPLEKRKRSATWAGRVGDDQEQIEPPPDLLQSSLKSHKFPNYGAALSFEPVSMPIRIDGIAFVTRPAPSTQLLPRIPELPSSEQSSRIVAALSISSVFEGLAIGFQKTVPGTWALFLAVAVHRFLTAFFIGVETIVEKSSLLQTLVYLSVYSLLSPASMGLAIALERFASSAVSVVLSAIASGAMLYVSCFEDFPMHGKRHSCNQFKFLGTIVGAGVMAAVQYALY